MIIGHNLMANNAIRNANSNATSASKSMAKLASGNRITTAADDAAGLSISEKMKGQIRGLDQASSNAQDGISLVQTADGALSETTSVLQRMRELAVQSSNDTNTTADREAIQTETDELTKQIDNIATTTQFNTKNLLDGGSGVAVTASNASATNLQGTADTKSGTISLIGTDITLATNAITTAAGSTNNKALTDASKNLDANSTIGINGTTFSFTTSDTVQNALDTINAASGSTGVTASWKTGDGFTFTSAAIGSAAKVEITAAGTGDFTNTAGTTNGTDAVIKDTGSSLTNLGGSIKTSGNTVTVTSGNYEGLSFDLTAANDVNLTVGTNNSLKMQIGANSGQTMSMSINDMSAKALGVDSLDLSTQTGAESALTAIDKATATVSSERSKLGAYQNRLTSTINNLGTTSENLTSAESSITDVDMAKEMSEFSKNNILSQAAQAMISQANQQPQQVLQLLR